MAQKKNGQLLAIYSVGHFFVDLACAFLMFSLRDDGDARLIQIILYNFFAFAVQMPAGFIADRLNRNGAVAAVGIGLTFFAFLLTPIPMICVIVLGLGNCLYHVGGGTDVLGFDEKKQWMLGVFVSPGAMGLFIGTLLAKSKVISVLYGGPIMLAISVAIVLGLHLTYSLRAPSGNICKPVKPAGKLKALAVVCLFLVVILRSYVGVTLYTPWKNGILLSTLAVLGLALGKAAGGFLADRFGAVRTSVVSLALCSIMFMFSGNAMCGILAIFLFNMTMPLTLFAMAGLFPSSRGFAFGCLTFALFLGCVPSFLSLPIPFYKEVWFHALEAAVSLVLLAVGLIACRKWEVTE